MYGTVTREILNLGIFGDFLGSLNGLRVLNLERAEAFGCRKRIRQRETRSLGDYYVSSSAQEQKSNLL